MPITTLTDSTGTATSWMESFFARDGMGWPLLFFACSMLVLWRVAKWLAPLVEEYFKASTQFMHATDLRLQQIENDAAENKKLLADIHLLIKSKPCIAEGSPEEVR